MSTSLIRSVQSSFRRIAPTSLAESWDNTGLLVESPIVRPLANKVLLTIDLTPNVLDEVLSFSRDDGSNQSEVAVIVAYHPTIFRGIKSLTSQDPLQKVILSCITSGISVYSPHTSLDSVIGGINDHLCKILLQPSGSEVSVTRNGSSDHDDDDDDDDIGHRRFFKGLKNDQIFSISEELIDFQRNELLEGVGAGPGRLLRLDQPIQVDELISRVKLGLKLSNIQFAESDLSRRSSQGLVKVVAVCAGSGGSILSKLLSSGKAIDAFLTGEMSHHEILYANSRGVHVLLTSHSNTERFYLSSVLRPRLRSVLIKEQQQQVKISDRTGENDSSKPLEWDVVVSKSDKDPICIV